MCKLRKAAVVLAALGGVGLLGTGIAHADGGQGVPLLDILQGSSCRAQDINADVLGEVGVGNGAQSAPLGSSMGCMNRIGIPGGK